MLLKLIAWLSVAMHAWVPTTTERQSHFYDEIAYSAAEVAYDPEEPPLYKGSHAKAKTALLLLAIASYESTYVEEVQKGKIMSASGKAWCLMQIWIPRGYNILLLPGSYFSYVKGGIAIGREELTQDIGVCLKTGLHFARLSFDRCHNLTSYTTGRCMKSEAMAYYRQRRAEDWFDKHPFQIDDDEVVAQR